MSKTSIKSEDPKAVPANHGLPWEIDDLQFAYRVMKANFGIVPPGQTFNNFFLKERKQIYFKVIKVLSVELERSEKSIEMIMVWALTLQGSVAKDFRNIFFMSKAIAFAEGFISNSHLAYGHGFIYDGVQEPVVATAMPSVKQRQSKNLVQIERPGFDIVAQALITKKGALVYRNSTARLQPNASFTKYDAYANKRTKLIEHGFLQESVEHGCLVFARDVLFRSSSQAASIVLGCIVSGKQAWKPVV